MLIDAAKSNLVDLNLKDNQGNTALDYAEYMKVNEIIGLLTKASKEISIRIYIEKDNNNICNQIPTDPITDIKNIFDFGKTSITSMFFYKIKPVFEYQFTSFNSMLELIKKLDYKTSNLNIN